MAAPEQKYRVISKIDAGGMAEVYKAEAQLLQGLKKQVAIKRILPHLTQNQKFVAMFLDEARLSLYLDHANIVHVFDIGRSDETYFIVMEHVDGVNLRTLHEELRKRNRPLSVGEAIFIVMEVCKGLSYAHDMVSPEDERPLNIVHRDVSPPNILISRNGEVKLVDFGLAKAASQLESTDPGVVKGKFSYLSPEAVSPDAMVDHRADIFACGIILWELITGQRLFNGETDYQTVELVMRADVPPLSSVVPDVPSDLDAILRRVLARDREERYQHAYELQDALAHILFAHNMKVISRDIAKLVRAVGEKKKVDDNAARQRRATGMIDSLIREEVVKFTSLDAQDLEGVIGAQPLSPDEIGASAGPLNPDDFLGGDWTSDLSTTGDKPQRYDPDVPMPDLASMLDEGTDPAASVNLGDSLQRESGPSGDASGGSNKMMLMVIVLIVVLAGAAIGLYFALAQKDAAKAGNNQDLIDTQ